MATSQLQIIESEANWKLDRRTIEIGRAGLAAARAALAAASPVPEFEPVSDSPVPGTLFDIDTLRVSTDTEVPLAA